jgi:hypothetical protein
VSNAVPIEVAEVFSPANIPGLVGWWDAADETTFIYSSGTEISEWLDKSPVGWHMTQTVISQQPGRQDAIQNGLAAIAYNPALWELMSAPTNVGKPFTLFFASSSYAGRLTWWSTTGGIYWATDSGNFYFGGPQAGPVTPADWLPLAYAFRNDGGAPAGTVFFRNGVAATGGIAAGESVQNLSVGSPTSDKFEAWHFEAILSNVYLSDAQMAEVSAYLREKWATP